MSSVTRRSLPAALVAIAVLAAPGLLVAQGGNPVGPEFRVNSYTTDVQFFPAIAYDSAGNFVVAWESYTQDGSDFGIYAQRYAASGAPLGGEFRVNSFTTSNQRTPAVASDSAGNFVVAWFSLNQDGSGNGIFGQRFASTGVPLGGEFRINTTTTSDQFTPQLASDPSGNVIAVWYSFGQDGFGYGAFGQRFASNGAPLGGEFQINTYTLYSQFPSSVAMDSSGNFVVVWFSEFQDGSGDGIFGRRYSSTGVPLTGEFRINTFTTGNQFTPAVAAGSTGNFVVTWYSPNQDGSGYGMFGQRFASTGIPLGGEFQINTFTPNNQFGSAVAADTAGNFVVAWESDGQDGSGFGIFGQRYASTGAPLGGEFRVNTYTTSEQRMATVASDPAGHFVVAWESYNQDGDLTGIFAQRFSMITPVELLRYSVE